MYDQIEERFGFKVPQAYRSMYSSGLFEPASDSYLHLSDTIWMVPRDIALFEKPRFEIPGLLPFARSVRADVWCWHTNWTAPTHGPVAFCPRDLANAEFFAPAFEAAVYRILLEELSGTWLNDPDYYGDHAEARLRAYVDLLAPHLSADWIVTLRCIVAHPLHRLADGSYGFIERAEADGIVRRDLPFPELDQEFRPHA